MIKIRDGQAIRNFACYLAIGVNLDGDRDVLGIWFQHTEGAKFWLQVLTDLKTRGVRDVVDRDHAERELEAFAEIWDAKYPMISAAPCTRRTRSRRSTASSARSSKPAEASPPRTPR